MQWSDIEFRPTTRVLRQFAGLWLLFVGGLAVWQGWRHGRVGIAVGLGVAAVVVGLPGLLKPQAIRWIFVGATILTFPIGWLVSHVILGLVFFGLFTPLALFFRLRGRDVLRRRKRPELESYWQAKSAPGGVRSYFRQY